MDKQDFKKSKEELQDYLSFRRRGSKVTPKKGKGSFKRKQKHKEDSRDQLSMGEHMVYTHNVGGSSPSLRTIRPYKLLAGQESLSEFSVLQRVKLNYKVIYAPVAQLVEQRTFNAWAARSSRAGSTINQQAYGDNSKLKPLVF